VQSAKLTAAESCFRS